MKYTVFTSTRGLGCCLLNTVYLSSLNLCIRIFLYKMLSVLNNFHMNISFTLFIYPLIDHQPRLAVHITLATLSGSFCIIRPTLRMLTHLRTLSPAQLTPIAGMSPALVTPLSALTTRGSTPGQPGRI